MSTEAAKQAAFPEAKCCRWVAVLPEEEYHLLERETSYSTVTPTRRNNNSSEVQRACSPGLTVIPGTTPVTPGMPDEGVLNCCTGDVIAGMPLGVVGMTGTVGCPRRKKDQ